MLKFKAQINGLRALAVLLVLIEHSLDDTFAIKKIGPGFLGVRLFFVLSGYLITGILLESKDLLQQKKTTLSWSLRQFYARRFLRIFPPYYFILLILAIVGASEFLNHWIWHTFYLSNFLLVKNNAWIPLLSHFWSLSVEEQFYLLWPLLILLVSERYLGILISGTILLGICSRGTMAYLGYGGVATRSITFSCLDILGSGALIAYLEKFHPRRLNSILPISLVVGGVLFALMLSLRLQNGSWAIRAIFLDFSAALLFIWAVGLAGQSKLSPLLENRVFGYLGKISYAVYLIHPLLPYASESIARTTGYPPILPPLGWFHFLVLSGITIGLASLSWYLFENPINQLKKYFPYEKNTGKSIPQAGREQPVVL